ncbi:MAG TPA: SLC13 family permease [Gemmatimonadaceae bacterium]|nr:SLC13 family permease [Gemmatimonadaceae bacterium]
MSAAVLALLALLLAIGLSMTARVNVGLLSIALAWIIGVYAAHMKADAVIAGFPATLFITLAGVTFLFAIAKSNGTLDLLAHRAARLVRGNAGLLPLVFFALACVVSTIGPGAVASVALVAPIAMPTGAQAGVPNLLSAIMVGAGANAGNLSPISAVGAMVNGLMTKIGLPGHEWNVWAANFLAHVLVGAIAYFLFGGVRLFRAGSAAAATEPARLERRHWLTISVTVVWMAAVIVWRVNVGLAAFTAGTVLILVRAADERDAIARIPYEIIFMVTGVTMLIGVLEATGGMELFTGLIARLASPATINAVIAFVTGIISTYSSTSGVVLPAFLPTVPGLVSQVGGGDPLAVALSINVGAALVDVSPLSTLGAICVACVVDQSAARELFRKLLIWGLSMAIVGAVLCGFLAGPFARL